MKKIKVNADIYVNDKKLAKDDDIVNIQKLLSGSSESEKTVQLSSINDFYDVKDGTDIKITSQYPIELFFHKKNIKLLHSRGRFS